MKYRKARIFFYQYVINRLIFEICYIYVTHKQENGNQLRIFLSAFRIVRGLFPELDHRRVLNPLQDRRSEAGMSYCVDDPADGRRKPVDH